MFRRFRWLRLCPILGLFCGCAVTAVRPPTPAAHLEVDRDAPPPPGEHHYVLIWAGQRVLRTPALSHTFLTIVHTAEPCPGQVKILDVHTISWLPATLRIRTFARHPEPGVNLTLEETLQYSERNGVRVSLWGPFECRPSFFQRMLVQKHFLETSGIGYQCDDNRGEAARRGDGCDCIHAITDTDPTLGRDEYPLIWFGDPASEHVAYRLRQRGSIVCPDVEHDEILTALGLDTHPIRRRHFDDRLVNFPRLQPAESLLGRLFPSVRQAPPYDVPPFPPPGPHDLDPPQP